MARNDFISGSISKRFMLMSLLTSIAVELPLMAGPLIAGNLVGVESVAVMNLFDPVYELMYTIALLFSMGSSLVAAQAIGRHEDAEARKSFSVAISSIIAVTLVIATLVFSFRGSIASFLCDNRPEITGEMADYLSLMAWWILTAAIAQTIEFFLIVDGHPEKAAIGAGIMAGVYLGCSLLFCTVLKMGIRGMALASILSNVTNIALDSPYIFSKDCSFKPVHIFSGYFKYLGANLRRGLPTMLENTGYLISIFVLNMAVVRSTGASGAVVWGVAYTLITISGMAYMSASEMTMYLGEILVCEADCFGLRKMVDKVRILMASVSTFIFILAIAFPNLILQAFGVGAADFEAFKLPLILSLTPIFTISVALMESENYYILGKYRDSVLASTIINLTPALVVGLAALFCPQHIWWSFAVGTGLCMIFYVSMIIHIRKILSGLKEGTQAFEESVPYDMGAIAGVLDDISGFLTSINLDEASSDRVCHCVDELCYNIIKHRPPRLAGKSFDVRIVLVDGRLDVVFKDAGRPFNPTIVFEDTALDALNDGRKLQLSLRLFNHYAQNPVYKFLHGINITRFSLTS